MTVAELRIAPNLSLPVDAVTESMAIVARKGRGKTYTAKVIAEEMLKAHLHIVILDPLGAWTGLRTSADGKRAGLPITILGGKKGDLPLSPTSGAMIADLVIDEGVSLLLDLSHFESNADQDRFARDFAVRLFHRKKQQPDPAPLHLFVDESDSFAPQQPLPGQQQMLGAFQTLVRRGRMAGIGTTFITQRPASLHKGVLTMTECLIVLQVTGPQDRKALEEWVKGNADAAEAKVVLDSLASLEVGEAWFWSPSWLRILKRVKIRKAETFDSSATPKAGQTQIVPKVLAKVDLDRLSEAMAETIERVKADDPKLLRKRVKELERELGEARKGTEPVRVEVPVEVPVLSVEVLEHLDDLLAPHAGLAGEVQKVLAAFREGLVRPEGRTATPKPAVAPAPTRRQPVAVPLPGQVAADGGKLDKSQRAVLTVLAQYPDGRTSAQLTTLTGRRYSGGFRNTLSALRTAGFMTGTNKAVMQITDAGLEALGSWEELPTGDALLRHWLTEQLSGMEREILPVLIGRYPEAVIGELLAKQTINPQTGEPYEYSGGFRNALSKLRTLQLVVGGNTSGVSVHPDFMEAISE